MDHDYCGPNVRDQAILNDFRHVDQTDIVVQRSYTANKGRVTNKLTTKYMFCLGQKKAYL